MASSEWLDALAPDRPEDRLVLDGLDRLPFTDGRALVDPGPVDRAILSLICRLLEKPGQDLLLQLPRGAHDVAILCGMFVQLARMVERASIGSKPLLSGPVVVIGMNTNVQERLGRLRIANVELSSGLGVYRLRHDGKLVDPKGKITSYGQGDQGLIYLNTRVGWPPLPNHSTVAVVIIDRTSFSSEEILDRALSWAKAHTAGNIVTVGDLGDEITERQLVEASPDRKVVTWPWRRALASSLHEGDSPQSGSSLSTNALLTGTDLAGYVSFDSAADGIFRAIFATLGAARSVDRDFPTPLRLVRSLANGLTRLYGSIDRYNAWAALDHRVSALSSQRQRLEQYAASSLGGKWNAFAETRWASLRADVLELYDLLHEENPKLFALAFTLSQLSADRPGARIVIRVPSEAAGYALVDDLRDLIPEHAPAERSHVSWLPASRRIEWTNNDVVEVYPTAPAWGRSASVWSGESAGRLYLTYPFEVQSLSRAVNRELETHQTDLRAAAETFHLSAVPVLPRAILDCAFSFELDRRPANPDRVVDLSVDTNVLFDDVDDEGEAATDQVREASEEANVVARAVLLEPNGEAWWIREAGTVETLLGSKLIYLPLDEIRPGTSVVVPRGEGRDELFARVVTAAHAHSELQAFDVFFKRWRDACWAIYRSAGTWGDMEQQMAKTGCKVTRQSFRAWARGDTIAPDDPEDIRRIGQTAGDRLLETDYLRLNAMARQIRGLHSKLGRLLSSSMSEAVSGGGPHLDALRRLLGGIDPSELLDEFELRSVRSVGDPQQVPFSLLRRVTPSEEYAR